MQEPGRTKRVVRTTMGLRDVLFDELDALRSGASTPKKASAMARVASTIVASVKIEIEHQKHVATLSGLGNTPIPSAVLELGNGNEQVQ